MFVGMLTAAVLSYCPFPYAHDQSATIKFETGSANLTGAARETIQTLLGSQVENPRAEFHIRSFFPYGANSGDPRYSLALERADQAKATAAALGLPTKQIAVRNSAIGFAWGDNYETYVVPFDAADLDRMEVTFRVRTACHPVEQHDDNDGQFVK